MVAYVFLPSFAPAILAGAKRQTIRAPRKRHARVGEAVDMLTQEGQRFAWSLCSGVDRVKLDLVRNRAVISSISGVRPIVGHFDLDLFAGDEGFSDWRALVEYWRGYEGAADELECVLIRWEDLL